MRQWLAFLVCAALLAFGPIGDASAGAGNANVATASQWCFGLESGGGGAVIQPLVECFTDQTQGIIPMVTTSFLTNAQADYLPTIGVIFLLAIAVFGVRLYMGQVERIKGETVIFGVKMAGIMLFLNSAPAFYIDLLNILQQLSNAVASVSTSMHTTGFCATNINYSGGGADQSAWQNGIWSSWDCIFKYLLGFSTTGFAIGSIAAFLLMILFSMGTGFIIFFTGLFLIIQLLKAAFRFVHVYLISILALSFIYCIGYLLVPLLLFKKTMKYFTKWLSLIFGYVLTPVLMFGFMGMMLVALDIAIFSGQYSVYCKIGGPNYCGTNAANGATLFQNITGNVVPAGTSQIVSGNPYVQDNFYGPGGFSFNGMAGVFTTDSSGYQTICSQTSNTGAAGFQGQMTDCYGNNITGSNYQASRRPELQNNGIDLLRLNMSALAGAAGSSCNTTALGNGDLNNSGSGGGITYYSNCPWIQGVLVSLAVAAVLTYIMGSLLAFIPQLASNITADLNDNIASQGMDVARSKMFGENLVDKAFTGARSSAMNYAGKAADSGRIVDRTLTTER